MAKVNYAKKNAVCRKRFVTWSHYLGSKPLKMPTQNPRSVFSRTLQVLFALAASVFLAASAIAAEATKSYSIASGPAATTLKQFADQSGRSVLFSTEKVQGISTNAISGELTTEEALDRLLSGTRLSAVPEKSTGGFAIRREVSVEVAEKNDSSRPANRRAADNVQDGVVKLDTFEVFGRKTLNMDIPRSQDDPQPYLVFDRQAIASSGAITTDDFLQQRLPMRTGFRTQSFDFNARGPETSVNLRGFDSRDTLVLVDGQRVEGISIAGITQQFNVNNIPISAISRIEVLPMTASGIYGGKATAGVINIILRRDYVGVETTIAYTNTFSTDAATRRADVNGGLSTRDGRTQVIFNAAYSDENALLQQDRNFFAQGLAVQLANNPNSIFGQTTPTLGATTNIRASSGANLTLRSNGESLGSPITYVPTGYVGGDGGVAFLANGGKYNFAGAKSASTANGGLRPLKAASKLIAGGISVRHGFSKILTAFGEINLSKNSYRALVGSVISGVAIPGTLASNPFNESVVVSFPAVGVDRPRTADMTSARAMVGLIAKLPHNWTAQINYNVNTSRYSSFRGADQLTQAARTAVSNGTINPFVDLEARPFDFSPYLAQENHVPPQKSITQIVAARAGGPLLKLPAGEATLSILVERNFLKHSAASVVQSVVFFAPPRSQATNSAYVEANFPLLNGLAGRKYPRLNLQVAHRTDFFRFKGSTNQLILPLTAPPLVTISEKTASNPSLALSVEPLPNVMLRASYATGFVPPSMEQLAAIPDEITQSLFFQPRDPMRGNEPVSYAYTSKLGGAPTLGPESSTSRSVGIVFSELLDGRLRISADYVMIEKTNAFGSLFFNNANLALEPFVPGLVTRAPLESGSPFTVGRIAIWDGRWRNLAKVDSESIDFNVSGKQMLGRFGEVSGQLSATKFLHNRQQASPIAPIEERVGTRSGTLEWRGAGSVTWSCRGFDATWSASYYGSRWINNDHSFSVDSGRFKTSPVTIHNVVVRCDFERLLSANRLWAKGVSLQLGVTNVLNTKFNVLPTLVDTFVDPALASYQASLNKKF